MKYIPSIAFDEMSGSAKGVTAAKNRGRKYIRNRGYGGSTRTSNQAAVKSIFKQLSQAWRNLTNAQILAWNALALTQMGKSILGTKGKISGANLFMRLNYWIVYCGGAIAENPPALAGVEAPSEAVITLTAEKFEFELENVPADTANLKLVILASEPQSNGVTRAYSKAAGIINPFTPEAETPVDLKASYTAKCGYPNEAAPRVFVKYFFVNTATGEKSGEMMQAVRLG